MIIGNREFDTKNHTYVMGILNVTPDSFSDGGKWNELDRALFHVQDMVRQGADLIDVGGESTRPGYQIVPEEEEIARVCPVIERIRREFDIPVSLDTCKSAVAKAGIQSGADLINDVHGLTVDAGMAKVIAEGRVPCCLMHFRYEADYQDFWTDMMGDLEHTVELARAAGIADEKIILDPGVGFGKTYEQNLEVIRELHRFHAFGYPVLLGTSRKSVIGLSLNLPADQRLEGTIATSVLAVQAGMAFVRVHDVEPNVRAIRMTEKILGK